MDRKVRFMLAVVAMGLCAGPCLGDVIDGDSAAIISGSKVFSTSTWIADLDYAVYAPGDFPGDHVDEATSYIYAYQVFNRAISSKTLSTFLLGLAPGSGATSVTHDSGYGQAGGLAPSQTRLVGTPPTSAAWSVELAPNTHSTVLLFSSSNAPGPEFTTATIANGGVGASQSMPSPIPEPATLLLLCSAIVPALIKRSRKGTA